VITVVVDPFSRLTLVTVVSALPVCDVVEVVEVAGPALSGKTIVVVLDGGAAGGATAGVWAAAGSADNKTRPNSGMMRFMSVKRLAARIVRRQGWSVADKVNHSLTDSFHLFVARRRVVSRIIRITSGRRKSYEA
jgi:hypothetical protein